MRLKCHELRRLFVLYNCRQRHPRNQKRRKRLVALHVPRAANFCFVTASVHILCKKNTARCTYFWKSRILLCTVTGTEREKRSLVLRHLGLRLRSQETQNSDTENWYDCSRNPGVSKWRSTFYEATVHSAALVRAGTSVKVIGMHDEEGVPYAFVQVM